MASSAAWTKRLAVRRPNAFVAALRSSLTHPKVRSLRCSGGASASAAGWRDGLTAGSARRTRCDSLVGLIAAQTMEGQSTSRRPAAQVKAATSTRASALSCVSEGAQEPTQECAVWRRDETSTSGIHNPPTVAPRLGIEEPAFGRFVDPIGAHDATIG